MDTKTMMARVGISDPMQAYEWFMQRRLFLNAAQVAQDLGFRRQLVVAAAEKAYGVMRHCGEYQAAADIILRFRLNMLTSPPEPATA